MFYFTVSIIALFLLAGLVTLADMDKDKELAEIVCIFRKDI